MTISTTTAKSRYAGDGSTTSFPTGFKFLEADHVRVVLKSADGSETVWTEGSEYSLIGAGAPGGGTVEVRTSPIDHTPAVGETLVVKLAVPPRQETALPLGGAFPSTAVEAMADLAALRDQQIEEALSRAPKFKETTALAEVVFPEPEAEKLVAWNGDGTALENVAKPADGVDGASILFGTGVPPGTLGAVGDCYKDTTTSDFYEKTGASTWTLRGNDKGPQGEQGDPGADGLGVPPGGTASQVLRKVSSADNDTEWGNPAAAPVDSVFGRFGPVTAQSGDYNADQIAETAGSKVMTAAERTKLAGVASGANDYTHPNHTGDVTSTGDGATAIANDAVTNAKMADMAQATIKGRASGAGTGDPADLSAAQVRTILNVADGAAALPAAASQAQAEDGASGTVYSWTPQRVHQAAKDAVPFSLVVAAGDETTAITTGAAKVTFRLPHPVTLTAVRASLTTVSSSGVVTVDINENGTTILSTKLTIDANEKTSATAATPAVISDSALADDAEITIDIDAAGTGAAGLKVTLIGYKTTT